MYKSSDFTKEMYAPKELCNILGVSLTTLHNYDLDNRLKAVKTDGGHRRYTRKSILTYLYSAGLLENTDSIDKVDVVYARVSSADQKVKGDLDRQALSIVETVSDLNSPLILKEVGSGLNDKRKELVRLLNMVMDGRVNRIYVTYKDRLTRFGYNYIETVCKAHGVGIIVLNSSETKEVQRELVDDMMSLIASFSGKLYGLRSHKNRKVQ